MSREFRLPDIGEGLTEAEIVRWLVGVGDRVEADQPIVEIETDKAVVEIPSPYAGTVLSQGGAEGDVIAVGEVLVVIGEAGEEATTRAEPKPIVGTISEEAETLTSRAAGSVAAAAVQALPLVRKLARDNDIDLSTIQGSGPDGRITREDVERAIAGLTSTTEPEATAVSPGKTVERGTPGPRVGDERRPMSRLRRTIAANMAKSWAEVPHVTTFDDIDATRLLEVREALGERHQVKVPMEALVVKAVIPALDAFPEFNATVDGEELIVHGARHMGIAVDTSDGLLVAVIRDAEQKNVLELSAEVRRLGEGARERTLGADELSGQTFTVSNIGAVGGGHGTPIVPPGTTAILSVGMARQRPIVYDGDLAIAPVMPLSLSYDHRVIDGAQGRRFMKLVMENLEEPALFLAG